MTHKLITLTIGTGFDKDNNPLTNPEDKLKDIRKTIALAFGGYTEASAFGGWVNPKGVLVEEPTKVFSIATDKEEEECVQVSATCRDIMQQHSVFLVVNNQPKFV